MMNNGDQVYECDFCKESLADNRKWVLLNRYGIGTGHKSALVSIEPDGQYIWDVENVDQECVSAVTLCYPTCLLTWIEGKMVEVDATPC